MKLYGFWRSLASFRVRVALRLKQIPFEEVSVNLLAGGQHDPRFLAVNPQGAVPALEVQAGQMPLVQSMAILDYLESAHPTPALLPAEPLERARVLALAHLCASDSHPLVVPRVREYLQQTLQLDEPARNQWLQHWTMRGLTAFERHLASDPRAGRYAHGDEVTLADICLASQVVGAQLFGCDLASVPHVVRIHQALMQLPAFELSHPKRQADAPQS
jgi:maleylacetoacetate isomerase